MGRISLKHDARGYYIRDVYCEKNFNGAPGRIPDDKIINTEHTWPQSRFGGSGRDMQKSDLHHLFPSDSELNSNRGNHPFGEVKSNSQTLKCTQSRAGSNVDGDFVFEPPVEHRGNVARALFYFAVRYGMSIDATQEATLRKWHVADPVDADETDRNDAIEKVQGNRNPFIDQPELVNQISNF
ncbi:MAG: endonuclease [Bdellovibrionaceae bacterium]|nr:endonuclease [Pseudobdellovibrionaceae bacterium]